MTTLPRETPSAAEDFDADVIVIGLGPTGLTMAHGLASRGVKVIALEREPAFYGMARAVFTDGECLRIMQSLGLADELHADMLHDLRVRWVSADGEELGWFHDPSTPQGWPTANFFYQPLYEQTLERGLRQYSPGSTGAAAAGTVEIRRGRSVTEVHQDGSGVRVEHEECAGTGYGRGEASFVPGSRESLRVKYVVACDGGRSVVRRQLGIEMKGTRFPQRWLVVDLQAPEGPSGENPFAHLQTFDFVCDPELPTVSCPQPQNRHRFEFMLHDEDVTEDFQAPAKAAELIERYCEPGSYVITRQLVYTFNALMAQSWQSGHIFLAGDAAHMTPQFVGQGMNSGLRDAYNLSWKLAEVLHGQASPELLTTYETERRPHAAAMMTVSVLNKDTVSTNHPALIRLRDTVLRVGIRTPGLKTILTEAKVLPRPRYRRGAYFGAPRGLFGVEGTLMPQPQLARSRDAWTSAAPTPAASTATASTATSSTVSPDIGSVEVKDSDVARFDDVVGNGWLAIGLGVDPRSYASHLDSRRSFTWVRLNGSGADTPASNLLDLTTDDATWKRWCHRARLGSGTVLVVRPDKVVFGVVRDDRSAVEVAARLQISPTPSEGTP